MRKIKRIVFLITVLFLTCCSNNNGLLNNGSTYTIAPNESLSSNMKPSNDSYTTTIDDYLDYCKSINDGSSIYCWKKNCL